VFVWAFVAAIGVGLFAYSLGLDRSDKLASIGSFVLALGSAVAAIRARPAPEAPAIQAGPAKYHVYNSGNDNSIITGDHNYVTINKGANGFDRKSGRQCD
jgi:hypothetical protein